MSIPSPSKQKFWIPWRHKVAHIQYMYNMGLVSKLCMWLHIYMVAWSKKQNCSMWKHWTISKHFFEVLQRLERSFPLNTVEYISSISWKYSVRFVVNLIGNCLLHDDTHSGLVVLQVLSGALINMTGSALTSIGSRSAREQDADVLQFCVSFLRSVAMSIWLLLASWLPVWAEYYLIVPCKAAGTCSFSAVSFPMTSFFCYAYLHHIFHQSSLQSHRQCALRFIWVISCCYCLDSQGFTLKTVFGYLKDPNSSEFS